MNGATEPGRTTATVRGAVLRSSIDVPAPPSVVWPFFSDARNLELLTPPWLRFRILTPQPITMGVDARIDYRLRVRGVPLRWRTRIASWEPPSRFADEQEHGPYRRWFHTHTFDEVDGGTRVGDHVEFTVRGGPLARWMSRWLVEPDVTRIFRYRLQAITARFGGDPASGRVWIEPAAP